MSRLFLGALTLAALLVPAGAATACLNDREVERTEREFKSSYIEKQAPPTPTYPEPTPKNNLLTYGGSGAGMVLLLGGFVLALRRVK